MYKKISSLFAIFVTILFRPSLQTETLHGTTLMELHFQLQIELQI